jgi:ABC-type multidrug transport system permease subunit
MKPIVALALKDLRVLLRVRSAVFFTFVWPIVVAVLFGYVFSGQASQGGRAAMRVAVVDEDRTDGSRAYLKRLDEAAELETSPATLSEATDLVRRGQRAAYVVIKPGFGAGSSRMFYGEPRRVEIGADPSRQAEQGMLEGLLIKYAMVDMQRLFTEPAASRRMIDEARRGIADAPPGNASALAPVQRFLGELDTFLATPQPPAAAGGAAGWQPLTVTARPVSRERSGPANAFAITFPQGVMWGIIGCVMTFAIGLVSERVHGTFVRLRMAPLTRTQVLAGKALACFGTILMLELVLFTIGMTVFGIRPHSLPLLALIGVCGGAGFVGFMMLVAGMGRNEQAAAGAGWAMLMPMTLLGGGMIPQFVMPPWMLTAGNISPVKWLILGMEGALWRGFSAAEMVLPCAVLLGFGGLCFAFGVRALRD